MVFYPVNIFGPELPRVHNGMLRDFSLTHESKSISLRTNFDPEPLLQRARLKILEKISITQMNSNRVTPSDKYLQLQQITASQQKLKRTEEKRTLLLLERK